MEVTRTIVLTGCRAGQSCTLGKRFRFTNGKLVLRGEGEHIAPYVELLRRQYQAYEEGSRELEAALGRSVSQDSGEQSDSGVSGSTGGTEAQKAAVEPGDGDPEEPEPTTGVRNDGPELPDGLGHRHARIRDALSQLEQNDRSHWTAEGWPKVSVVAALSDLPDLTRREIETAAPHFKREGNSNG